MTRREQSAQERLAAELRACLDCPLPDDCWRAHRLTVEGAPREERLARYLVNACVFANRIAEERESR